MRTKALLLGAAITAASLATSLAQVYSLNVVGYVNLTLPSLTNASGFMLAANPLDQSNISGNNTINSVLPPQNNPVGLRVYTYDQIAGYTINNLLPGDFITPTNHWQTPGVVLAPGTGFWLKSPSNELVTVTFVGEVKQGNLTNPIPAGFQLRGSIVPQQGILDTQLGYPATPNSTRIYTFSASGYSISTFLPPSFDAPSNHWSVVPVINVGQGFWTRELTATNWVRTFNVQ